MKTNSRLLRAAPLAALLAAAGTASPHAQAISPSLLGSTDFRSTLTDPHVVFCEDFSGADPLADFTLENPPAPSGGQSAMTIGINDQALTFDHLSGFGVANALTATTHAFADTSVEAQVRIETSISPEPRGFAAIGWADGSTSQGYILFGLQLDEDRAYIFAGEGSVSDYAAASLAVAPNTTYLLRLGVTLPNLIEGYVDDQLVVSLVFDLSLFPAQMNLALGGNSYPSLRLRHDNLVLRVLNLPPVAVTTDVTVSAGPDCTANASIDDGSFDLDPGDDILLEQSPAGPYPLGTTTVTLTVTDSYGATDSATATVTVVDTTPPTLTPPPNQVVDATAPTGATVHYPPATANDCSGSVNVGYSQAAGTVFPIGTTTITVTATDLAGNTTTRTFTVKVNSPAEQTQELITEIAALPVNPGTITSLTTKLDAVLAALASDQSLAAAGQLRALINEARAQRGKKLTVEQADSIIAAATTALNALGYP